MVLALKNFFYLMFVCLVSCAAVVSGTPEKARGALAEGALGQWCQINPPGFGEPSDWIKLPQQSIHVVRAEMQEKAKSALTKDSLVELTDRSAKSYLREGETVSRSVHLYLVRGAAFYVNKDYELMQKAGKKLPLDAFYSPSRKMLAVVDVALAKRGTLPSNLALIIESDNLVSSTRASCLAAE